MELKSLILLVLAVILALNYLLSICLTILNLLQLSDRLPNELHQLYDAEQYKKSQQYERDKGWLGIISETVLFLISFLFLISGGYGWLDSWTQSITSDEMFATLLFFGFIALAGDMINLPFSLYATFVIEERYGFNRTTIKTFVADRLKGYALAGFLGGSLLALFILFYQYAGASFWIYMLMVIAILIAFLNMFYTSLILPLFNKLSPLPNGDIRTAIEDYCRSNHFEVSNIFVMDGSKRSAKANAFFSGIGSRKKIVLFDTLINDYTKEELVAVLAHEIGHYKKHHTVYSMILSLVQVAIMLGLFSVFMDNAVFSLALGADHYSLALSMIAFALIYAPVSLAIGVMMNMYSRKNEFEADHFAKTTYHASPLISALKKLSTDSLSNLNPHPWYVFFYYSHPPLLQRLNALETPNL